MEFELLYMIQKLHTPFLDEVMKGITFLGESGWFWILLAVLLFCPKRTRKIGLAVALSLACLLYTSSFHLDNYNT